MNKLWIKTNLVIESSLIALKECQSKVVVLFLVRNLKFISKKIWNIFKVSIINKYINFFSNDFFI
jgi:hypothetical protein